MFSGFDAAWLTRLGSHIDALERRSLEQTTPNEFDLSIILDGHSFLSIEGLANFWDAHSRVDFAQCMTDLVIGTHGPQSTLIFVLAGTPQGLTAYISLGSSKTTETMLKGIFPGIRHSASPVTNLRQHLNRYFQVKGVITGIPSSKGESTAPGSSKKGVFDQGAETLPRTGAGEAGGLSHLERVVRGMYGASWAYIVQAYPRPRQKVSEQRLEKIDLLAEVMSQARIQLQATEQESTQITQIATGSTTKTYSGEMVNYRAQYLTGLLEREIERLDEAGAIGQWLVHACFGAGHPDDAQRLAALLTGTLAGKDSRPDPVRAFLCGERGRYISDFSTLLSSREVASLIQFPREEVPGYAISDFVQFDVDFRPARSTSYIPVTLGSIQHNAQDAGPYEINLHDLSKHAVVVGVTGSGKTTTVMNLLDHLVEARKPFLIIEPAKTEYRALRPHLAGRADVRIYTLGNETSAPFRLNPFEFEIDVASGRAAVVTHIDFLKAVFNAAFILYAPMPYVLEIALHEIYEDKGWDLASGQNSRLTKWSDYQLHPIFPTLTDLYHKVEDVVNRFRYDPHTDQTVKAGLKARIGSLRIGSKGLMLDTPRGTLMQQLLSYPTILEMENIGSDDEKTFLMGLLLAKLYEYRRLQAASGVQPQGLQHLLVFEEAHRLLKNTETQVDTESSNMRAQAIEVFTNMLSEVRAYGQGVLVAEQIPGKLAPDVLKNTNLKIVHRLVAQDDRMSVGQTMNLNAEQMNYLGTLPSGMAAVYAEGADHAYKVRMDNYKGSLSTLTDTQLKGESPKYASVEQCLLVLDLHRYSIVRSTFGGPDAQVYQYAARLLDSERGQRLWATILIRTVFSRPQLPQAITMLEQQITAEIPSLAANQREATLRMTLVRGCAETLHRRGAMLGWAYPIVEELRILLTRGLIAFMQTGDISLANADLDRFARRYEKLLERDQGAFHGCTHCRAKCLYRPEVRLLLLPNDVKWVSSDLKDTSKTRKDQYASLAKLAQGIAKRWLGETNFVVPDVGYCGALHAAEEIGLTDDEQRLFGNYLSTELLK